jgi:hypothetical protein
MVEMLLLGGSYLVVAGGGYVLATHIHSIANMAAQRVVTQVAGVVGTTATLLPATPPVTPPAAPQVSSH